MYAFRVDKKGKISMISCDTVSSVFSKMISVCKAGACSVMMQVTDGSDKYAMKVVNSIRASRPLHVLSSMVRQIREMSSRITKRRKVTIDTAKNIVVDEYRFPYNDWSNVVPRVVAMMELLFKIWPLGRGGNVWWICPSRSRSKPVPRLQS